VLRIASRRASRVWRRATPTLAIVAPTPPIAPIQAVGSTPGSGLQADMHASTATSMPSATSASC
jgi:hypothetical protein